MTSRQILNRLSGLFVLSVSITLLGCGSESKDNIKLAPVSGKVTYKGKPLTSGSIVFSPVSGEKNAEALIQSDGTYTLGTYDGGDGAMIGNHKVSIISIVEDTGVDSADNPEPADGEAEILPGTAFKSAIPEKYNNVKTSGLTKDVKDESNTFDFDLAD